MSNPRTPRQENFPREFENGDGLISAVWCGDFTRGQARALFANEIGCHFTEVRVIKTCIRREHPLSVGHARAIERNLDEADDDYVVCSLSDPRGHEFWEAR